MKIPLRSQTESPSRSRGSKDSIARAAAAGTPGVESISQSFALIVGITFGIVVLVVGFFFLILTVQKLRSFVALRAIGAGVRIPGRSLIVQIALLVLLGSLLATAALLGVRHWAPTRRSPWRWKPDSCSP